MKTLITFHLICLAASLPLLSTVVEASDLASEGVPKTVSEPRLVRFDHGHLTVMVGDVSLSELLDEIARQSGVTVVRYVALNQRVSLEFHRLSVEQALRRILRHRSFVLEYAAAQPRALWILPQAEEAYAAQRRAIESTNARSSGEDTAAEISRLQAALSSADVEDREEAAMELGESGQVEAVAALSLALADKNKDVREAAIVSLAEIGGAQAAQALAIALADHDPRIREEAVDALGEIGGETAIGLLRQALADNVKFVREAAAEMLDELRGSAQ
jgi:HEAT repeat protein